MEMKHVLSQYPHITETDDEEVKEFLRTLSHGDLEQIVIDYKWISKHPGFDSALSIELFNTNPLSPLKAYSINYLDGKKFPIEYVVSDTRYYFDLLPNQIQHDMTEDGVCHIKMCIPLIEDNFRLIRMAMDYFGYNLCTPEQDLHQGHFTWILFEYRPLKDDAARIREEETKVYYLIPYYKKGVLKQLGLNYIAQKELFNAPRKLYLLKGSLSKDDIKRICMMRRDANPNLSNTNRFLLYTIDLNKIPSDAKLYLDPNNSHGIYTPHVISQDAIINMEELKI